MTKTLPGYFHNIGTRLAINNMNQKTLRVNQVSKTSYLAIPDGLAQTRKEFRVDPVTQIRIGATSQPNNTARATTEPKNEKG